MNFEQNWNSILETLRNELPRAAFETWVQDAVAVPSPKGTFTIAARNSYARDWLEQKLSSRIQELLGKDLKVKFIVNEEEWDETKEEEPQSVPPPVNDRFQNVAAANYDTIYDLVVRPDRAVYLPGYFKRWLKVLGPELGWMYVSFRQAAYRHGGRSDQFTNRFTAAELAARAGITERTFWNRSANPSTWEKLEGLVNRVNEQALWDHSDGSPKQLPRKFTVAMTLPLTPEDSAALRRWLTKKAAGPGGSEAALRAAASAPMHELLAQVPNGSEPPLTVRQLVFDMFKNELDPRLLETLAALIQNRLMPVNDQIKITLFFLEHVMPYLGAGPAWMVTLLRDQCFSSEQETRNHVVVKQGYAEIAGWLGIRRIKTIWEWLTRKIDGVYGNALLRLFVSIPINEQEYEHQSRTFRILLEEVPAELLEALVTRSGHTADLLLNGANFDQRMSKADARSEYSLGMAQYSAQDGGIFSPVMADFSAHLGVVFSHGMAQLSAPHGAAFIVKTPSNSKTNTIPLQTNPEPAAEPAPPRAGNLAFWDFDVLMRNNAVNPGGRKKLLEANQRFGRPISALTTGFVSWLLYAHSPAGARITDPSALAIRRLSENISAGAGGEFNKLARLEPFRLKALFDADLAGVDPGISVEADLYKLNFQPLMRSHKLNLYQRLFGTLEEDAT